MSRRTKKGVKPLKLDSMASMYGGTPATYSNINPGYRTKTLDRGQIYELFHDNHIANLVVTKPAEDMTRNGWEFTSDNEDLDTIINKKLKDLSAQTVFAEFMRDRLLWGDAFIALGVVDKGSTDSSQPIGNQVVDVDYINCFDPRMVDNVFVQQFPFNPDFGKESSIRVTAGETNNTTSEFQSVTSVSKIYDSSRYLHASFNRPYNEDLGRSVYETIFEALKLADVTNWSAGQILRDLTFKTYKSPSVDTAVAASAGSNGVSKLMKLRSLMDMQFSTEALALIGSNDDVAKQGTQLSGVGDLINFMWDDISAATHIPKTVLLGQQSGKVSGTQTDVQNYYSYIKAQQETILRPYLERLITLLLQSADVGNVNPDTVDWKVNFNPLWQQDSLANAQTALAKSQALTGMVNSGALSAEEAHDAFLENDKSNATNKYTGDSKDFIDDRVKKEYQSETKRHKNWFKNLFK